ncbi:MAG: tetratricopeptide repeat protein, partial [Bacteroidia bacterium]|nr:tetratricopeptide repeat protein [Bacteroidia bacterium]
MGKKLEKAAKYDSAAIYYEQAAEIWKQACPQLKGEKRKYFWEKYVESKNRRGGLFDLQGKVDSAALRYLEDVLLQARAWLGENHFQVAASYNNMAVVYDSQGQYTLALEYQQKALQIRIETLGQNHPEVAMSYNNMALVYKNQGQYALALEYHQKALDIRIAILEKNHP